MFSVKILCGFNLVKNKKYKHLILSCLYQIYRNLLQKIGFSVHNDICNIKKNKIKEKQIIKSLFYNIGIFFALTVLIGFILFIISLL